MGDTDPGQPIFLGGKARKCGRYDFERFDHLGSQACAGYGSIGKVTVDCRLLFRKSQWGYLGNKDDPAGVIYMDLSFNQPGDCRIRSATVMVTVDDEDGSLEPFRNPGYDPTKSWTRMTTWFGPKHMRGPEKVVQVSKNTHANPYIDVVGYGVGGLGQEVAKEFTYSSRWEFTGQLLPHQTKPWQYKTLRWDLTENDLEQRAVHSNVIHTAFAFEHDHQPLLMKVEVMGKLERTRDRLRSRLKFGPGPNKDANTVVTLVKFGSRAYQSDRNLSQLAESLAVTMAKKNYLDIPSEIPNSLGAKPEQMRGMESEPTQNDEGSTGSEDPSGATGREKNMVNPDPTEPTTENLANIESYFISPVRYPTNQDDVSQASSTVVAGESDSESSGGGPEDGDQEILKRRGADERRLLEMMKRQPAMFALVRLIAYLLGLLSWTSSSGGKDGSLEESSYIHAETREQEPVRSNARLKARLDRRQ